MMGIQCRVEKSLSVARRVLGTSMALLVLCAFIPLACDEGASGECIEGSTAFSDKPLPTALTNVSIDCTEQAEPPSLELWAGAADSVLVGTVTKVCPLWEPAVVAMYNADPPYVDAGECSGALEGGIQVSLADVETLYGADWGSELTITLGAEVSWSYSPVLLVVSGREMVWFPSDEIACIESGQRIGGAMYKDPDWGFIGPQKRGVFFQMDGDGKIRFQDFANEYCYQPVPVGVDGMSFGELQDALDALDLSDPALQALIQGWKTWDSDPIDRLTNIWGAKCFPGPDCSSDTDCAQGLVCRDGFCEAECTSDADCGPGEACVDGSCL